MDNHSIRTGAVAWGFVSLEIWIDCLGCAFTPEYLLRAKFQLETGDPQLITPTMMSRSQTIYRSMPWLAIVSGILGILSFACLVAYITTPTLQMQASGVVSPVGKLLLRVDFLSSMEQAMLMIPVTIWLYRNGGRRSPGFDRSVMILGGCGFGWRGTPSIGGSGGCWRVGHSLHGSDRACWRVARCCELE
jgi:hypothetical protein